MRYLIPFFALFLSVFAENESKAATYKGLYNDKQTPYAPGQPIKFAIKWTEKSWFNKDFANLEMNVVRHRVGLIDPKVPVPATYSELYDSKEWRDVTFTLPSNLHTGYYYLLWESKVFGDNKAKSDLFYVASDADQSESSTDSNDSYQTADDMDIDTTDDADSKPTFPSFTVTQAPEGSGSNSTGSDAPKTPVDPTLYDKETA